VNVETTAYCRHFVRFITFEVETIKSYKIFSRYLRAIISYTPRRV